MSAGGYLLCGVGLFALLVVAVLVYNACKKERQCDKMDLVSVLECGVLSLDEAISIIKQQLEVPNNFGPYNRTTAIETLQRLAVLASRIFPKEVLTGEPGKNEKMWMGTDYVTIASLCEPLFIVSVYGLAGIKPARGVRTFSALTYEGWMTKIGLDYKVISPETFSQEIADYLMFFAGLRERLETLQSQMVEELHREHEAHSQVASAEEGD